MAGTERDSGVRDWGNPLLPKGKRHEKTDNARKQADESDDFLASLDELLSDDPAGSVKP